MRTKSRHYKRLRQLYVFLVQVDYLAGLSVAFMLGASRWAEFSILLAVSLILGCVTVLIYTAMMESMYREVGGK